jgi:hypothetical protein
VADPNGRFDSGTRRILEEIRELRREMRDDRRRSDARWEADRRQAEADRRHAEAERRRSDERFEALLHEFRQDSARRVAAAQRAFKDIHAVGFSIVKTLNRHTRLLERIDRKLGGRNNGRPDNGRAA